MRASQGARRAGPGPQLTVRVGTGSRWTRRRTARGPPVPSRWLERISGQLRGPGGAGSRGGEGTPFSMTMPRRLVQRRRNQRFIGSS